MADGGGEIERPVRVRFQGGSPYILFQNQFQASAKQLAPATDFNQKGKLKPEVRARIQQEARSTWKNMPPAELETWREIFRARQQERKRTAEGAALSRARLETADGSGSGLANSSHGGDGAKALTVHPCFVQEHFNAGRKLPEMEEVYDTTAFKVSPRPVGAQDGLLGDEIQVTSCPLRGCNLCRGDEQKAAMAPIVRALAQLIRAAGKAAKSGDLLILAEAPCAALGQDTISRRFALLAAPMYKPIFQDLSLCVVVEGFDTSVAELQFPFEVQVANGQCRLQMPGQPPTGVRAQDLRRVCQDVAGRLSVLEGLHLGLRCCERASGASHWAHPTDRVACEQCEAQSDSGATAAKRRSRSVPQCVGRLGGQPARPAMSSVGRMAKSRRMLGQGRHADHSSRAPSAQGSARLVESAAASGQGDHNDEADMAALEDIDDFGLGDEDDIFEDGESSHPRMDLGLCALAAGLRQDVGNLQEVVDEGVLVETSAVHVAAEEGPAPADDATTDGLALASAAAEAVFVSAGWEAGEDARAAPEEATAAAPALPPPPAPHSEGVAVEGLPVWVDDNREGLCLHPDAAKSRAADEVEPQLVDEVRLPPHVLVGEVCQHSVGC